MKLGILCTMINGFGRKGFYNTQEIGLGRALARMGHRVVIYKCLKNNGKMKIQKEKITPSLTIYYIPISGLGAHGFLENKVLSKDLDGILCFSDNQVFLPHIFRFCRKWDIGFVPYVGTTFSLHGGVHGRVMNAWFAAGTGRIYRKVPVIAKTDGAARELQALGAKDVAVAPVGLDMDVLKANYQDYDKGELRKSYGFSEDDVVICNVSRLEPEKRPLDMLEMFGRIREEKKFKLLLVGEGPLEEEVRRKISLLGMEKDVLWMNRVSYSQMWKIYAISDYFISLNRGEIFGMAIMEAVYYRVPAAAYAKAPGPSLILSDMEGHLLYEDDKELERWLTGPYPSKKALDESGKKVAERFSWDRCAHTFVDILERRKKGGAA